MKKRLLSAALALAMVLTMLPLTAFAYTYASPEPEGDGTETVAYLEYGNTNHQYLSSSGGTDTNFKGAGWYVTINVPAENDPDTGKPDPAKPAKTVYYKVDTGLSVGGKYYEDATAPSESNLEFNYAADGTTKTSIKKNGTIYSATLDSSGNVVKGNLKDSVIVIGGTFDIDAVNASSLSLDVYGGTATIKQNVTGTNASAANPTKLTSLTVNNSQYLKCGKGEIDVSAVMGTLTRLDLKNVTLSGSRLTLNSKVATTNAGTGHTVSLTNVTTSVTITLDGKGENKPTATHAAQSLTITNSTVGAITVKGVNNTVTLNEVKATTAPAVTIEGTGGSLNVRGGSVLGTVTVKSGADKETTAAPSSITVETGSTVANISSAQDGDQATGRNTITIGGTSGAITAKNSTVNVNGGHTGNITLTTGAVSVSGNRASVGDVKLAHDATFNLTGTNCTVGELAVDSTDGTPATVTFNVPNDPSNTLGSTSAAISNYTKKTVKGGTWKYEVDDANLDASLAYQLKKGATGSTYTYYTSDQLGEAILEQGADTNNKLTKIGDSSATNTVTFMNGSMLWGEMMISPNVVIPKLPTQMNNIKTPYWSDGEFSNLTGSYSVPNKPGGTTLNAGGGMVSTDVTKLTEVKVGANTSSIKAALAGSTIVLSGAVESGNTMFELTLETDAVTVDEGTPPKEVPVTITLSVIFDPSNKSLTIANPGSQSLGHGVVIENGFQAIKLSNGSRYTFDGKGLVVRTEQIKVKGFDAGSAYPTTTAMDDIEVIVSAPGYTATQALKDQIINLIKGADAAIDLTKSPAVKRAVNAALATMTDATVQNFINAAAARARSDWKLGSKADTAYSLNPAVWLVPYLEVNVSNYLPNPVNPSITATLTLKWRVEVHPTDTSSPAKGYIVKEAANVANDKGTFIAKQGTALTLDGDLTGTDAKDVGIEITFKSGLGSTTLDKFAHQADTYDYEIVSDKFTVTHAVNGNLGRFVLDTVKPLIRVGDKTNDNQIDTGTGKIVTYFSTLQAAVDAAEDGKMIEIDSNYKGSTTINMTGKARTIYIQANGKNVVVANASGGMVENNEKGSFYTIKLNRDNTVTANAVVSVGSASNGSASVDTTIAKPGSSVSGKYTASSGYKAGSFTATAQPGNKSVSVSVSANGTFSFTVPSDATSVTVTPSFVLDNGLPFTDVANNAWYFTAVKYCYDTTNNGYRLMEGDSAATFAPNGSFTRAHMVQILWNMKGRPTPKTTANPFRDMSSSNWYYSAVLWAYENGYAKGYPDGTFKPGQAVTRQEMVQFLYQASGSPSGSGNLSYYSDGYTANNWAQPALRWATGLGILSGQNSASLGNTLAPRAVAKRCEVAVTVMNFDKLNLF